MGKKMGSGSGAKPSTKPAPGMGASKPKEMAKPPGGTKTGGGKAACK